MSFAGAIGAFRIPSSIRNAVVRAPLAFTLGSITFTVGFYRLVVLSFQFMSHIMRGEAANKALLELGHSRGARHCAFRSS